MATGTFTHSSWRKKTLTTPIKTCRKVIKSSNLGYTMSSAQEQILLKFGFLHAIEAVLGSQDLVVRCTTAIFFPTVDCREVVESSVSRVSSIGICSSSLYGRRASRKEVIWVDLHGHEWSPWCMFWQVVRFHLRWTWLSKLNPELYAHFSSRYWPFIVVIICDIEVSMGNQMATSEIRNNFTRVLSKF